MKCAIARDHDWYLLKLQEELGELTAEYLKLGGRARQNARSADEIREALADETADVFAHLLLFAKANDIDIASALHRKWYRYLKD